MYRLLILNPGSTSTKVAIFQDDQCEIKVTVKHDTAELSGFANIMEQLTYRKTMVDQWLKDEGALAQPFHGIMARGGLLQPIPSGTYPLNASLLEDLRHCVYGTHASNLAAIIADAYSRQWNVPAFVTDPVVVDEMEPQARLSGTPGISRRSIFHALNQKAMARRAAQQLGKAYDQCNLIIVHMGGGISVGTHRRGQVIDVNNALDGEGPMSPERSGTLPVTALVRHIFAGGVSRRDLYKSLVGSGGLVAHTGTNDGRELERRANLGEEKAKTLLAVMAYQTAKEIGRAAMALKGHCDAVVLTGGLAYSQLICDAILQYSQWIAPHIVLPGEHELEALAEAGWRVLSGTEAPREYPSGRLMKCLKVK